MKYPLVFFCFSCIISCRGSHDGVDDEYSRGFFNALAIVEHRNRALAVDSLPYWQECKKSYIKKEDLYNNWDAVYMWNMK